MSFNFLYDPAHWDKSAKAIDDSFAIHFLGFYAQQMIQLSGITTSLQSDEVTVLDVATGSGLVAREVAKLFVQHEKEEDKKTQTPPRASIYGVDFSQGMIDAAQKNSRDEEWSDLVHFEVMDGQALTFEDEKFDYAFSLMGVIFFQDIAKGIRQMNRVLKKNGKAVIATWTNQYPNLALMRALDVAGVVKLNLGPIVAMEDKDVIKNLMEEGGLPDFEIHTISHSYYEPLDQLVERLYQYSRAFFMTENPRSMELVEKSLIDILKERTNEEGLAEIQVQAHVIVATKN